MTHSVPDVSVVIPVYNEASNLPALIPRVMSTMEKTGKTFEIIAVDDGSSDSSIDVLKQMQLPQLRIVQLTRNFGQTPAIYAGFEIARGRTIVTIDADLQNPPEEIPRLLVKLDEGYEVAQGWRETRHDSWFRRRASRILNFVVSKLIGAEIRDLGCGLKAYRREVVERMSHFSHHSRYIPAEVVWLGAKIAEVKVDHQERANGDSKYSIFHLLRLNFDMISSISSAPIKIIGLVGWLFAIAGFLLSARIFALRIIYGNFNDLASVMAVLFVVTGVHLIATSIVCEYIGRIYTEVQNKPYYIVKDVLESKDWIRRVKEHETTG